MKKWVKIVHGSHASSDKEEDSVRYSEIFSVNRPSMLANAKIATLIMMILAMPLSGLCQTCLKSSLKLLILLIFDSISFELLKACTLFA